MVDAQELLSHVIVDPNDHDPDKRMEIYNESMDFENIFVEPPDLQSCDVVWLCSESCFERNLIKTYKSQRFWFCFLAAIWGIAFAVTSYCETFIFRPMTEYIKLSSKIPGPRKCFLIYARCCKQLGSGCFIDDEDEKMETKSV